MNRDAFDDRDREETPVKPKMSGTSKLLLGCAVLSGVSMLVCCGGGFYLYSQSRFEFEQSPVEAAATLKELGTIDVPPAFKPHGAIRADVVILWLRMAVYHDPVGGGSLVVGETNFPLDEEQRRALQENPGGQGKHSRFQVKKMTTREFKIRGNEHCVFTFAEGIDPEGNRELRRVTGNFPGKKGTMTFLHLDWEEEAYDEEAVIKMLESIK